MCQSNTTKLYYVYYCIRATCFDSYTVIFGPFQGTDPYLAMFKNAQWNFFIQCFIFHCKRNGIPLTTTFLCLKQNVLYWPDDDRLRLKHVATV